MRLSVSEEHCNHMHGGKLHTAELLSNNLEVFTVHNSSINGVKCAFRVQRTLGTIHEGEADKIVRTFNIRTNMKVYCSNATFFKVEKSGIITYVVR